MFINYFNKELKGIGLYHYSINYSMGSRLSQASDNFFSVAWLSNLKQFCSSEYTEFETCYAIPNFSHSNHIQIALAPYAFHCSDYYLFFIFRTFSTFPVLPFRFHNNFLLSLLGSYTNYQDTIFSSDCREET